MIDQEDREAIRTRIVLVLRNGKRVGWSYKHTADAIVEQIDMLGFSMTNRAKTSIELRQIRVAADAKIAEIQKRGRTMEQKDGMMERQHNAIIELAEETDGYELEDVTGDWLVTYFQSVLQDNDPRPRVTKLPEGSAKYTSKLTISQGWDDALLVTTLMANVTGKEAAEGYREHVAQILADMMVRTVSGSD